MSVKDVANLTDQEIDGFSHAQLKVWIRKADQFLRTSGSCANLRILLKRERDTKLQKRKIDAPEQEEREFLCSEVHVASLTHAAGTATGTVARWVNRDQQKPNNRARLLSFIHFPGARRVDYWPFRSQRVRFIFRRKITGRVRFFCRCHSPQCHDEFVTSFFC